MSGSKLVPRASVPPGAKALPAMWAMKCKGQKIATKEIYKWKARLNNDGSKQEEGVNFWAFIRMVLINRKNWMASSVEIKLLAGAQSH